MSPSQLHDHQQPRREINGPRPSPLKVNTLSHFIHKSSSSSSSSAKQQRHPVIIYTHSPKIIHTKARDFMALVQKLTGFSRSDHQMQPQAPQTGQGSSSEADNDNSSDDARAVGRDENGSNLDANDENHKNSGTTEVVQVSSSSGSTTVFNWQSHHFSDIPLFTPNSTDFFSTPRPFYIYPDSVSSSPNIGRSISPSGLKFMKELPDY